MIINFVNFISKRLNKEHFLKLIIVGFITIINSIITLFIPLIQKSIMDYIKLSIFDTRSIILLALVGIAGSICFVFEELMLNSVVKFFNRVMQCELLSSVLRKRNKIIEAKGPGAYMVNVFSDSNQISSLLSTNYFSIIINCITTLIILIISLRWSFIFASTIVPTYIIMAFILIISNKKYINMFEKGRNEVFKLNPKVLEFIENRQTVIGYSNIYEYEQNIKNSMIKRDNYFKKADAHKVLGKSLIESLKNISMVVFFIFSMIEILKNELEISSFIAMITYFSRIFIPVFAVNEMVSGLNKFKMLKSKIKSSLDIKHRLKLPKTNKLCLSNCSFSYDDANNKLKDIKNLNINIDKKIGLVGLSGEGKTTIIKLLSGKVKANKGCCLFGNENIVDISKIIVSSNIQLYSQEPQIFNSSLNFNIALNKIKLTYEDYNCKIIDLQNIIISCFEELIKNKNNNKKIILTNENKGILRDIFMLTEKDINNQNILHNIILNIPINFNQISYDLATSLASKHYYVKEKYVNLLKELNIEYLDGRDFGQRGSNISGGEKNKICLARFLLPENKNYFIIDEPFTSLDLLSERNCMDVLKKYLGDTCGIIISHKLNIIKELSDEIITLENGEISNIGTHDELVKDKNIYSELFNEYSKSV